MKRRLIEYLAYILIGIDWVIIQVFENKNSSHSVSHETCIKTWGYVNELYEYKLQDKYSLILNSQNEKLERKR